MSPRTATTDARPSLVRIENLVVEYASERYTVRPLDGFELDAPPGQLIALLGPSGSGKTTLLSILSGMIPATSGSVVVDGIDVLSLSGSALEDYRRKTIGIVFQGFNLIPSLSARENVAAPLLVAGVKRKEALARADALLAEVGLDDRADHMPKHLSGGQQQRVAVARGLVGDPKVLLADEPTANLDHISAEAVVQLLRSLRDRGRTIIISTHDDRLLPAMDQVVYMTPEHEAATATQGEITLVPGEVLFRQGTQSDYIYDILDGTVDVVRELSDGTETVIASRSAGAYVGELGPLLGFPRSAQVRAQTAVTLQPLTMVEYNERHDDPAEVERRNAIAAGRAVGNGVVGSRAANDGDVAPGSPSSPSGATSAADAGDEPVIDLKHRRAETIRTSVATGEESPDAPVE